MVRALETPVQSKVASIRQIRIVRERVAGVVKCAFAAIRTTMARQVFAAREAFLGVADGPEIYFSTDRFFLRDSDFPRVCSAPAA
jgi:hypothetical protein